MLPTHASDQDIFGTPEEFANTAIEHGTVGHEGDTNENYFQDKQNDPGGTIVNVTLFRGRDPSVPLKGNVAQGHPIVCRLAGPWMGVPARGAQCFVAFPGGFENCHGIGVLVAAPGNPRDAMNKSYARHGTDGSYTIGATSAEGLSVFFKVGPKGFIFSSPWMKMRFDATGFHIRHVSGAGVDGGAVSGVPVLGSAIKTSVSLTGDMVSIDGKIIGAGPPVGTGPAVAEPVAKATQVQTVLGLLATALGQLAVPGELTVAAAPGPVVFSPTLLTSLANLVAGLGVATPLVASESTQVM